MMFTLSEIKKGFSYKEIHSQFGFKRYKRVWAMVHKLGMAMGQQICTLYTLDGIILFDKDILESIH